MLCLSLWDLHLAAFAARAAGLLSPKCTVLLTGKCHSPRTSASCIVCTTAGSTLPATLGAAVEARKRRTRERRRGSCWRCTLERGAPRTVGQQLRGLPASRRISSVPSPRNLVPCPRKGCKAYSKRCTDAYAQQARGPNHGLLLLAESSSNSPRRSAEQPRRAHPSQ